MAGNEDEGYRSESVHTHVAAFLQAWGCPIAPVDALPAGFRAWGIAVQGAVRIDDHHRLHLSDCPAAGTTRPVGRGDLTRAPTAPCPHCPHVPVALAADSGLFALTDLLYGLHDEAVRYVVRPRFSSGAYHVVECGRSVLDTIATYREMRVTEPARFGEALNRFAGWVAASVERASAALRRQGLDPHTAYLTDRWGSAGDDADLAAKVGVAASVGRKLAADVGGGPDGAVVCSFRVRSRVADLVLLAAPDSAAAPPAVAWHQRRAIAVLPAPLAVLLYVDYLLDRRLYTAADHPMAFLGPAPADPSAFPDTARTALCLWDDAQPHPHQAWRTALATTA